MFAAGGATHQHCWSFLADMPKPSRKRTNTAVRMVAAILFGGWVEHSSFRTTSHNLRFRVDRAYQFAKIFRNSIWLHERQSAYHAHVGRHLLIRSAHGRKSELLNTSPDYLSKVEEAAVHLALVEEPLQRRHAFSKSANTGFKQRSMLCSRNKID